MKIYIHAVELELLSGGGMQVCTKMVRELKKYSNVLVFLANQRKFEYERHVKFSNPKGA